MIKCLVTDSYDVVMSANSKEILDKYKKFNKVVFRNLSVGLMVRQTKNQKKLVFKLRGIYW